MTNSTRLQSHISEALGLSKMTEQELGDFLGKVGSMAVESALLRFATTLSPEDTRAFESWLEKYDDVEVMLEAAAHEYPEFAQLLDEEITALHESIAAMV